jgi:hypothetical protein
VSKSQPVSEGEIAAPLVPPQPVSPLWNPSYPRRVHIHERAHWQGVLKTCEDRVSAARARLAAVAADSPDRPRLERLFVQMLGARDQVADAARRLPGEVGDLYEEDRHRLEEALAALDRVTKAWDGRA